jgi:hypothetical protein
MSFNVFLVFFLCFWTIAWGIYCLLRGIVEICIELNDYHISEERWLWVTSYDMKTWWINE